MDDLDLRFIQHLTDLLRQMVDSDLFTGLGIPSFSRFCMAPVGQASTHQGFSQW